MRQRGRELCVRSTGNESTRRRQFRCRPLRSGRCVTEFMQRFQLGTSAASKTVKIVIWLTWTAAAHRLRGNKVEVPATSDVDACKKGHATADLTGGDEASAKNWCDPPAPGCSDPQFGFQGLQPLPALIGAKKCALIAFTRIHTHIYTYARTRLL